jgi:hypothetical protein
VSSPARDAAVPEPAAGPGSDAAGARPFLASSLNFAVPVVFAFVFAFLFLLIWWPANDVGSTAATIDIAALLVGGLVAGAFFGVFARALGAFAWALFKPAAAGPGGKPS